MRLAHALDKKLTTSLLSRGYGGPAAALGSPSGVWKRAQRTVTLDSGQRNLQILKAASEHSTLAFQ